MYQSRFLQDKSNPVFNNDYERAWLERIPPEHLANLRRQNTLADAMEYFELFVPEVPERVRRFCWIHA